MRGSYEGDNMSEIRTEVSTWQQSTERNRSTEIAQLPHEKISTAYNHRHIMDALKSGRARDMANEPKVDGIPAFIIGSGPSLDAIAPLLKDWKGGIVCSFSQASTLMYHGVVPTHLVALDPFSFWSQIHNIDWAKTNTKLVAHPGVWTDTFENWPNEILLYRQFLGSRQSYYATDQRLMYSNRICEGTDFTIEDARNAECKPLITQELTTFACSPPTQMIAAQVLGYGTMFLAGLDFGYPTDLDIGRFTKWAPQKDGTWVESRSPFAIPEPNEDGVVAIGDEELFTARNGVLTASIHSYYCKNFLTALRLADQTAYSCDNGIINVDQVPHADAAEVVKRQGEGYAKHTKAEIAARIDPYLAYMKCFVIEGPQGYTFIESDNPRREAITFMRDIRRTYACTECKCIGLSQDDVDHTGENCKSCPHGKMERINDIDVEANMARLETLLANTPSVMNLAPGLKLPPIAKSAAQEV